MKTPTSQDAPQLSTPLFTPAQLIQTTTATALGCNSAELDGASSLHGEVEPIIILGAMRAGDLEPNVRTTGAASLHAPAAASTSRISAQATSPKATIRTEENYTESGAEVWQELVRMLIAREASKSLHPAGRSRN